MNQPSQQHRNYARAGFDRPHMLQMGFGTNCLSRARAPTP